MYQVLSEFDENATILLQHLECSLGASLMAGSEHVVLLLLVGHVRFGVQGRPIAKSTQRISRSLDSPELPCATYSLMQIAKAAMTRPVLSAAS